MKCPQCKGRGESLCHLNYGDGRGEWKHLPCSRCKGTKEVPDEQAEWIEEGQRIRAARIQGKPYKNLIVRSKELGISVVDLSAMESGTMKPYTLEPSELAELCPECEGSGTADFFNAKVDCEHCDGTGTKQGDQATTEATSNDRTT